MSKIEIINEILKIKPNLIKIQSYLFSLSNEELKIKLESIKKGS